MIIDQVFLSNLKLKRQFQRAFYFGVIHKPCGHGWEREGGGVPQNPVTVTGLAHERTFVLFCKLIQKGRGESKMLTWFIDDAFIFLARNLILYSTTMRKQSEDTFSNGQVLVNKTHWSKIIQFQCWTSPQVKLLFKSLNQFPNTRNISKSLIRAQGFEQKSYSIYGPVCKNRI